MRGAILLRMDYPDYRPHAVAGILFLVVVVIGSSVAISRHKFSFTHIGKVVGWALTAMFFFLGVIGSVGPPNASWGGLAFFSVSLLFWLRFGLRALKAMALRKHGTE